MNNIERSVNYDWESCPTMSKASNNDVYIFVRLSPAEIYLSIDT